MQRGKKNIHKLLKGPDGTKIRNRALSNEWGRLSHGKNYGVKVTYMIRFIELSDAPTDQNVTYASFLCDYQSLKTKPWRVRLVVGGEKLTYSEDTGSPASNIVYAKILLNSVISDACKGARLFSAGIQKNMIGLPYE